MIETLTQKHTIEDYQRLPEGAPYQLIDGELIMSPAPKPNHQKILLRIIEKLIPLSKGRGDLFVAPVDVYCDDEHVFQPDIIFISVNTTDVVGGGAWGQRPHTISEPTLLVSNRVVMYYSSWIIFKRVHMLFTDASIILFGFQNIDIRFW